VFYAVYKLKKNKGNEKKPLKLKNKYQLYTCRKAKK